MARSSSPACGHSSGLQVLARVALLTGAFGLVLSVVLAMDTLNIAKEKARSAEAKQNLHDIQIAVEHFFLDFGEYPPYLSGGSIEYAQLVDATSPRPFQHVQQVTDLTQVADPLLRNGMLTRYPANPFLYFDTPGSLKIHQQQLAMPGSGGADALRNGEGGIGASAGTRFGPACSLMGQMLADPRFEQLTYVGTEVAGTAPVPSYCSNGYDCWDIWAGDAPKAYLPGAFFYKSNGILAASAAAASAAGPVRPERISHYILGVYGPVSDQGRDVIGAEVQVRGFTARADGTFMPDSSGAMVWPWTRSVADPKAYDGSPYGIQGLPTNQQFAYGNPNGVRDGVLLVLTTGAVELPKWSEQ